MRFVYFFLFCFSLTSLPFNAAGQSQEYARTILDTLCGPGMEGRAYVNDGEQNERDAGEPHQHLAANRTPNEVDEPAHGKSPNCLLGARTVNNFRKRRNAAFCGVRGPRGAR